MQQCKNCNLNTSDKKCCVNCKDDNCCMLALSCIPYDYKYFNKK